MTYRLRQKKSSKRPVNQVIQNQQNTSSSDFTEQKSDDSYVFRSELDSQRKLQFSQKKRQISPISKNFTLNNQIYNILKNTLLNQQIPLQLIQMTKKILFQKLKFIIHKSIMKGLYRNPKNIQINQKDLLKIAQSMGYKYKTKIAKTIIYMNQFQKKKGLYLEDETNWTAEKKQYKLQQKQQGINEEVKCVKNRKEKKKRKQLMKDNNYNIVKKQKSVSIIKDQIYQSD